MDKEEEDLEQCELTNDRRTMRQRMQDRFFQFVNEYRFDSATGEIRVQQQLPAHAPKLLMLERIEPVVRDQCVVRQMPGLRRNVMVDAEDKSAAGPIFTECGMHC
jgi:hypothetical protein